MTTSSYIGDAKIFTDKTVAQSVITTNGLKATTRHVYGGWVIRLDTTPARWISAN